MQIGSAIGTHAGPGAPSGRLLGAGDLHLVSRVIPGSLAMAVPHGAIYVMTIWRIKSSSTSVILEFDVPSYWTNAAQQRGQSEEVNRQN